MELVKRDRLGGGASRHGGVSGRVVSPCTDDEDTGAYEEWNGFVLSGERLRRCGVPLSCSRS